MQGSKSKRSNSGFYVILFLAILIIFCLFAIQSSTTYQDSDRIQAEEALIEQLQTGSQITE